MPWTAAVWSVALTALLAVPAGADAGADSLALVLRRLQAEQGWAEAVVATGEHLTLKVQAVAGDTVVVRRRLGPLYEQTLALALADLREVAPLPRAGDLQVLPVRVPLGRALAAELMLPGAGYLYAGEGRMALVLAGVTAVAAGTALATGRAGAAAWAPAMVWIRVASWLHLRDEIRARNGCARATRNRHRDSPDISPGSYWRDQP